MTPKKFIKKWSNWVKNKEPINSEILADLERIQTEPLRRIYKTIILKEKPDEIYLMPSVDKEFIDKIFLTKTINKVTIRQTKKGSKITYIGGSNSKQLTPGNKYEVVRHPNRGHIIVKNDSNKEIGYSTSFFLFHSKNGKKMRW